MWVWVVVWLGEAAIGLTVWFLTYEPLWLFYGVFSTVAFARQLSNATERRRAAQPRLSALHQAYALEAEDVYDECEGWLRSLAVEYAAGDIDIEELESEVERHLRYRDKVLEDIDARWQLDPPKHAPMFPSGFTERVEK